MRLIGFRAVDNAGQCSSARNRGRARRDIWSFVCRRARLLDTSGGAFSKKISAAPCGQMLECDRTPLAGRCWW